MLSIPSPQVHAGKSDSTNAVQRRIDHGVIRVLLLEQDPTLRLAIRRAVSTQKDIHLIDVTNYRELTTDQAAALRPDALILDVETLRISGLDIEIFLSQGLKPALVFLTMHGDFTIKAFELGATDYLLKPFSQERFEKALERIRIYHLHRTETSLNLRKRIAVTDRRRTYLIPPNEIEWVSAAGDYTELHVNGATHLLREPFSTFLARLPSSIFCRIHRSFAVNLTRITGFKALRNQDLLVRLQDKTVLRASRTFSSEFKKIVSQHCA